MKLYDSQWLRFVPQVFHIPEGGPPGGDPPKDKPKDGGDPPKLLTQEEVNALLAKERKDTEARVKGKYADYDTLQEKAKKADEIEAAARTEQEKLIAKAREEAVQGRDAEWAEKIAVIERNAQLTLLQAEVKSKAASLNFHDGEDAWLRLADQVADGDAVGDELGFDKDGKIVGIEAALTKLAKDKPYLIKTEKPAGGGGKTPPLGGGGRGNGEGDKADAARANAASMIATGTIRRRQ